MELTIGRESGASRLHVTGNGLERFIGNAGSVPRSVSRQHCKLSIDAQGNYTLFGLKPENPTYVNGLAVEEKRIYPTDRVELGSDRYLLDVKDLVEAVTGKPAADTYSIAHLKQVWETYTDTKLQTQIKERKSASIRSVTGIISMCSIACGFIPGLPMAFRIALYAVAMILGVYFFVIGYRQSAKAPLFWAELDKKFHEDYVCPNPKCRRFLGYTPYNDLRKTKGCYQCNAKYKE